MKPIDDFVLTQQSGVNNNAAFEIFSLGSLYENNSEFFNTPQCSENFEIIWITNGNGIHYIDLQKYAVTNNSLFFTRPNQVHQLQLTRNAEGYLISFSDSFLGVEDIDSNSTYHSSLFKLFSAAKGITIQHDLTDMKSILEKMIKEHNGNSMLKTELIRKYFRILLIYITRQLEGKFETTGVTRNIELVQQFMNLLEKNFREQKMVADYASMLSVTPNYLNEIIKKTTGSSAGHHIRQRIVLEAKRQAAYSNNCMKEIAYCLGFGDMAHFSKFFKNTTGMNFSDFKKEKRLVAGTSFAL